jgi:hypothetical protein
LTCTVGTPPPPPFEYEEFKLCVALGCLPTHGARTLDDLPEETYQLYTQFMRVEQDAAKLKGLQRQFYG